MQNSGDAGIRLCGARMLAALLVLMASFALVFHLWPQLDLQISALFYDPKTGFSLADRVGWDLVLFANKATTFAFVSVAMVFLALNMWQRGADARDASRYWGMVILLYLIGPGALVNLFLKRVIGRARPAQLAIFGGDAPFSAAFEASDYCRSACSFVSAEVASGTALAMGLALGALWFANRPAARLFRGLALLSLGLLLLNSLQRIGSGRHYVSDVIFAALPVAALALVLAGLMRPRVAAATESCSSGHS